MGVEKPWTSILLILAFRNELAGRRVVSTPLECTLSTSVAPLVRPCHWPIWTSLEKNEKHAPFEEALSSSLPCRSLKRVDYSSLQPHPADSALPSIPRKLGHCPRLSHSHLSTPKQHSNASSTGPTPLPRPSTPILSLYPSPYNPPTTTTCSPDRLRPHHLRRHSLSLHPRHDLDLLS